MVPYHLGKMMDYDVSILYPRLAENCDLPSEHRGVRLIPIDLNGNIHTKPSIQFKNVADYVSDHAAEIDVLMLFYGGAKAEPIAKAYKRSRPDGKLYVKMDINPYDMWEIGMSKWWKRPFIWINQKILRREFLRIVDVVSCETSLAYKKLSSGRVPYYDFKSKLVVVPNGIDEGEIREMSFGQSDYSKKENLMITVGRLGTYQKNTEMLLDALAKVDLKDWKFYMIGSVEKEFLPIKEAFMRQHPQLEDKIKWMGEINDRLKLYKIFNKSKVLVLSSRFESFALVFVEAQRFANYVVSTPVGAIDDVVKENCGEIVPNGDADKMAKAIQKIVDGDTNIDVYREYDLSHLSWEYRLQEVVNRLKQG